MQIKTITIRTPPIKKNRKEKITGGAKDVEKLELLCNVVEL
jgi:hypothetical protein